MAVIFLVIVMRTFFLLGSFQPGKFLNCLCVEYKFYFLSLSLKFN